ncbi:hypothetical protein KM043_004800 [Ampulex compressa]|nr:hypothetical protein KM043_004800 [Ampulex compressa]
MYRTTGVQQGNNGYPFCRYRSLQFHYTLKFIVLVLVHHQVGKLRGGKLKIWCVTIDTAITRNELESASRQYWERLCFDLRIEASSRLAAIVEFLSSASKELERKPGNVEEVGMAYKAHTRITQQSADIAEEVEAVTGLAKVLAAWTSEKLDGVNSAYMAWQDLADHLERHKIVVARELEDAKLNLSHRAIALKDERERWEAKWVSQTEAISLEWITSMKERWSNLKKQRDVLQIDCEKIGLNVDEVLEDNEENLRNLEEQLEEKEYNCKIQKEFMQELRNQETEEWAVARKRLHRLHDWLDSWENRMQDQLNNRRKDQAYNRNENENLTFDTFIGKKIHEIRTAIEWIQLVCGDEIAEEHWVELKPLLGLDDVTNSMDITLGHMLRSATKLEDNADQIKEITKRAVAECGIRQTLMELEVWEESSSLQLQEAKDSRNATIILVAEYGNLLARAGMIYILL